MNERTNDEWTPKTKLGKEVKEGKTTSVDKILDDGRAILEPEIVDFLLPGIQSDAIFIGQSKGKLGGGKRKAVKQTQKVTEDGSTVKFTSMAVIGNNNGIIGLGIGKSKDTLPSKNKSVRNAKTNMIKIRRGCGSWACGCAEPHSIPFKVMGKCGSVEVELIPAPKGTGLKVNAECAKLLKLAGIKDIWSKTKGHTESKLNNLFALFEALKQLSEVKVLPNQYANLGIIDGSSNIGVATIEDIEKEDADITIEDNDDTNNNVDNEDDGVIQA